MHMCVCVCECVWFHGTGRAIYSDPLLFQCLHSYKALLFFFCILFCFVSAFCISYSIIYGISYKAKRQAKATKREEELQWRSHNRTLFSDCVCLFKHEFPIVYTHTHVCRYTTVRVCVVLLRTNKNKISINILSGAKTWKSS